MDKKVPPVGRLLAPLAAAAAIAAGAAASAQTGDIGRLVPAARGARPPALELADLDGRTHRLADYRGKVVLVNFWATWCVPCRAEMPSMQRLAATMGERELVVLAVNYGESPEKARAFAEQTGFRLPILLDAFHQARADWKVRVLPASFVIGPDGRLRYTVAGEIEWDGEATLAALRALAKP